MTTYSNRIVQIDLLKGFAIILVVFGHCLRGLFDKHIIGEYSIYHYLDYSIYTFHMPVFFIISGLFFSASFAKGDKKFWSGKIKTIVYPYFIWSIIQGVVQIVLALNTHVLNHKFQTQQLLSILWQPISPFWFLYALFFCNVICYFLINKVRLEKLAIATICFFGGATLFDFNVVASIAYGMIYFLLGIYLNRINFTSMNLPNFRFIFFLLFIFVVTSLTGYKLSLIPKVMFLNALIGAYVLYSFSGYLIKQLSNNWFTRHIEMLGQYSMSIFVMHILALGLSRTVLTVQLSITNHLVLIIIEMICGIYIPVLIQRFTLKLAVNDFIGLPFSAKK